MYLVFFFFQAEDGIRDLVRSRGLGDVYKRQSLLRAAVEFRTGDALAPLEDLAQSVDLLLCNPPSVSYTHLTLPTSDLV